MREVDIVYLYEHKARELDAACAVAAILENEHHLSVEIVQWPLGFPRAVTNVRPRLVILPYCYSNRNFDMLLAYWRESIFFNLAWEQIFYLGNEKAKTPRDDFPLKHVFHHSWSAEYVEFLNNAGIPKERIFFNGQPAYTLYEEPYRLFFSTRTDLASRYKLDPFSRWIFFPENYNWAFYSENMITQFVESGQSPDDIRIMQDYCKKSLTEMLYWCADAAKLENIEIILRPRPSTSMTDFIAFVNSVLLEMPLRFHILQQESVREWILASDMVISSHSTSLIEAAIAGKCTNIVTPFPIPSQLRVKWHDLLPHITTKADFLQIVKTASEQESSLNQWARTFMMSRGDAIRNLSDYFVQLLSGAVEVPLFLPQETISSWFKVIPPAWIWALYRSIKGFLRHSVYKKIAPVQINDYIARSEIRLRVQKWVDLFVSSNQEK